MTDVWRAITDDNKRDLTQIEQSRMNEIAAWLWERNPIANRMIEIPVSYLSADGCKLKSNDPDIQQALTDMWNSPINRMDEFLEQMFRELSLFGEQVWPIFSNTATGAVQVAYLDPTMIDKVIHDPNNSRQPIGIQTKPEAVTQIVKKYKIFIQDEEKHITNRTRMLRNAMSDGECLYLGVNKLAAGSRGRSDLLPAMDWLDALDSLMYGEIDRAKFLRSFVWHLQLEDADEPAVKLKAKEFVTPSPSSTYVSNKKETLTAVTPDFKAVDGKVSIDLFRNHCLASMSIPQHWYADAGDVNRATADAMAEPAFRALERRQRMAGKMLVSLGNYAAHMWAKANRKTIDLSDPDQAITCEWPEMIAKDAVKYTEAMVDVISAVENGIRSKMMTKAEGIALINAITTSLGVTIDIDGALAAMDESIDDNDQKLTKKVMKNDR